MANIKNKMTFKHVKPFFYNMTKHILNHVLVVVSRDLYILPTPTSLKITTFH